MAAGSLLTPDPVLSLSENEDLLRKMTERASKPTPEVYLLQKAHYPPCTLSLYQRTRTSYVR